MDKIHHARRTANPGRRAFLGFTAAGLAVPLGAMAPASWRSGRSSIFDALSNAPICRVAAEAVAPGPTPREIRLCWNANSVCHTGIATADLHGYFARHNLKVERINFSGASDQLLELLASGKADAGVGMALGWLKPLEQGFDVKLTAATAWRVHPRAHQPAVRYHRHCRTEGQDRRDIQHGEPGSEFRIDPGSQERLDPLKDIDWRVYPADLLGVALQKGEIQAFSSNDPIASIVRDRDHLVEVTNNLAGDFANRACCVLGIRAGLVRDERPVAAAITAAIMEAQEWVAENSRCRRR